VQASWPIPSDLQTIEINAYPLTFSERGSGTPLILVHGSVADYRAWSTVMETLSSRYRVIAPNLRHYYPESWKGEGGNFSAEQHGDDLAQLAKALNLGKANWLGWSRGGLVMLEVAKRYPEVVRSLIFEDGAINMPVDENEETREAVTFTRLVLQTLQNNIRGGDLLHAAEEFCDTLGGKGYWSRLPNATRDMILQNIYTALGDIRRPITTREEVSRLDAPILLLTGERSPKHYAFYYGQMRKCRDLAETVVIPNAGHAIHTDNPDRFLAAVLDFLAVH
jgi:esterase